MYVTDVVGATFDLVVACVHHHRAGLQPFAADQFGASDGGDDDVGFSAAIREIDGTRVGDRHGRILLKEHQRGRLAENNASADDQGTLALDRDLVVIEQGHNAERRRTPEPRQVRGEAPERSRGDAIDILFWAEGEKHGATAYGTETMHVLRAEKGYIIVGQDTDGTVTPNDAGLDWAVGKKKTDFVGIRGLTRPDLVAKGRKQLVGLKTKDPKVVLEEGAQIVADPRQPVPMKMIGHVTSSYWSENCGRSIALALLAGGRDRMGETIYVPMPNGTIEAEVTGMVFFDEKGDRLNG